MIGINHWDNNGIKTQQDAIAPEHAMAPSSSEATLDPLRASVDEQENERSQEQHLGGDSLKKNLKDLQLPRRDTNSDQLDDDTTAPTPGQMPPLDLLSNSHDPAPGSAQPDIAVLHSSNEQESKNTQEGSTPQNTTHEDTFPEGATPALEGAADEQSAVSDDQREREPRLLQHQGMIIITRPKIKRPPLRAIDLDSVPKKSILKKESAYPFIEQPVRNPIFNSLWLQSTVSKLAVMSGPAPPTAYTANSPSMFRKLVTQATAATMATPTPSSGPIPPRQRPVGPPIFANNERPLSLLEAESSSSSLLSDKYLKRVRFSVGQLTTEHVFHHDDAYESAEESESIKTPAQIESTPVQPKPLLTTTEGVVVDDNIYTATEIMNYYLVACSDREEPPIDRFVHDMQAAAKRPSNPLLTTIDLSGEPLPRKTLEPISDVLTLEFGLKQLYLDNCGFEDDTLKMLLYSLLLTDTLTVLSVQDNKKIKSNGFKYISVFVKKTKALKVLNISGIAMEKRSVEFLAHALRVGRLGFGSRLEELRMDRCGLRGNLLEVMAPAIRESNLRHVSMRSNRIGSTGGVWIGVLMRDYDDQPNVTIPNNNEEQGFRRVFPGISNPELLKRTHGVEVLDISDNDLRQGADYVAQTLRRNMSLKSLVMTNNNLDPARLSVLADALKLNIGLESLDLSGNRVCGPMITGINALTQKLTYNKTLTRLTLSNTGLQSEGAIALAEFLPETSTLTQLDLTGNDLVDIAGVMALSVSIRMNKSLTCLDMNVPPNDAEFARMSRDILRACISNMEEKTGSNAGMPSLDDMPSNTIFRQLSPVHIPEPIAPSDEDRRWILLETVAGELYRTRETLNAMEKALNHEKVMRRNWLEHFYQRASLVANQNIATVEYDQAGQKQEPWTTAAIATNPEEKKMLEVVKGVLYRAPPQLEQLYHQCKRHQANINSLNTRVNNDRALRELETMYNLLVVFLDAYRGLFALPELPPNVFVGKRTNSLPPVDSADQSMTVPNTGNNSNDEQQQNGSEQGQGADQGQIVPEAFSEEATSELESSFLLEDEDDMDEEEYTNDALIDVRRTSLLAEHHSTSPPAIEGRDIKAAKAHRERGLKPPPVETSVASRADGERSPIPVSPLEKLRKAVEEEEGEVLRRGKGLLENGLEPDLTEETMSGEELKIQILAGDSSS
ncbi:hypothetical protein EDD21DRAFT_363983 [Dissophora ornata]|nr:hypothetical protein EDD21DRAFT_363983 [Dissophora ornata]